MDMRMGVPGGMRMSRMSGVNSGGGGHARGMSTRQAPPVEHTLNVSLEDLYRGASKRMRITKKVQGR